MKQKKLFDYLTIFLFLMLTFPSIFTVNIAWGTSGPSCGYYYKLPFPKGELYKCTQGNFDDPLNTFEDPNPTHTENHMRYAWDFVCYWDGASHTTEKKPIYAPNDAEIDKIYLDKGEWGHLIILKYPDSTYGKFAHNLNDGDYKIPVKEGDFVKQGDSVIAYVGGTGGWAPHIHYQGQIDNGANGESIRIRFSDVPGDGIPKQGHYYTSHAIGMFEDGWHEGGPSKAFLECYNEFKAFLGIPHDNGGGKWVHQVGEVRCQDYIQAMTDPHFGDDGQTCLIYNEEIGKVFLVKEGFWDKYKEIWGFSNLGAPKNNEYMAPTCNTVDGTNYGIQIRQDFQKGHLIWDGTSVTVHYIDSSNTSDIQAAGFIESSNPENSSTSFSNPPENPSDSSELCMALYDPVCGNDGNTYSNSCWAEINNVKIIHTGECLTGDHPISNTSFNIIETYTQNNSGSLSISPIYESITLQPGPEEGKDYWATNIFDYGDNYGVDNEQLQIGGDGDYYESLLKFNLEGLPSNIMSANICLYCAPYADDRFSSTSMFLDRILENWQEDDSWFNKPTSTNIITIPTPKVNSWYEIDVTSLVKDWQNNEFENHGIILRPCDVNAKMNVFYSSDYTDPNLRPKLVVTYLPDQPEKTYYADNDGDGFGNESEDIQAFSAPPGYVDNNNDCDDTDLNIHPDAIEIFCNGIDEDCTGDDRCDEEEENKSEVLNIDEITGKMGEEIIVPIKMESAPNEVSAFGLEFKYSADVLEYSGFEKGNLVESFTMFDVNPIEPGRVIVAGFSSENGISEGSIGDLVLLKFIVINGEDNHCYPLSLENTEDHLANLSSGEGYFCFIHCDGDLNEDEKITSLDALIAFKCYLQSGPCQDCADANQDGKVTSLDALCLFRNYLKQPSCLD